MLTLEKQLKVQMVESSKTRDLIGLIFLIGFKVIKKLQQDLTGCLVVIIFILQLSQLNFYNHILSRLNYQTFSISRCFSTIFSTAAFKAAMIQQ